MSAEPLALILGVSGLTPTPWEAAFLREINPFGFILFRRNVRDPDQVRALTESLRALVGRPDAPVLIDQEGGRVHRLKPPLWRAPPPAEVFGQLYARDPALGREAAWLNARLIAHDLLALGIDTDCLPVLDVRHPGAHDIVGDRAFSEDPDEVTTLGAAVIDGLEAGGVYPVVKHIPGHGRAQADSHEALPVIDTAFDDLVAHDLVPFRALAQAPFAMTAHILYTALDADAPATLSPTVIERVIRGACAFDGLLMTDDLSMKALAGSMEERSRRSLAAGCDLVLHCNGDASEMEQAARGARPLDSAAQRRWDTARQQRRLPDPGYDAAGGLARLGELLNG
ncbi:beta-N-acetylhexosaminidase [Pararhodospirillum photometricum]|uniref:beta-N-acetylhexosaminidase n=1 Tax=Pararhodospirillum photometricum TaxID=1084 RepID=UPI00059EECCD|nr:beta-N-acetylhexosaminidase [Pararhodospirillum photometricum]